MKKPKVGSILLFAFLVLWAAAMIGLVVIGFTNLQPQGIGGHGTSTQRAIATATGESHHGQ